MQIWRLANTAGLSGGASCFVPNKGYQASTLTPSVSKFALRQFTALHKLTGES
jgi:hypothetical protein